MAAKAKVKKIELSDWSSLVKTACKETSAARLKKLRIESQKWPLPFELADTNEDDEEVGKMRANLNKRIQSLNAADPLAFELCCLRDSVSST